MSVLVTDCKESIYITYKFLQVKYSLWRDGKIIKRINPKRVTALRRKLKKLSLKVQNGEIPYIYFENMIKGWMGSYYKLLSKAQRKICYFYLKNCLVSPLQSQIRN